MGLRPLFLLLILLVCGHSHPRYWLHEEFKASCTDHPVFGQRYGRHPSTRSTSSGAIRLEDSKGQAVTSVCPGASYTLTVEYPQEAQSLVSTSYGSLSDGSDECPNRALNAQRTPSAMNTLAVPCRGDLEDELVVTMTFATGSNAELLRTQATIPRGDNTSCSPCAPEDGAPLPSMQPPLAPPAAAPPPQPTSCPPSSLGYACSQSLEGGLATLHWTVGRQGPPNVCTGPRGTSPPGSDDGTSNYIFMALEGQAEGYVSASFAEVAGTMVPAQVILGSAGAGGGNSEVGLFAATASPFGVVEDNGAGWAFGMGVARQAASRSTVICFGRAVGELQAQGRGLRLSSGSGVSATDLRINWALSNSASTSQKHFMAGGLQLNALSGGYAVGTDRMKGLIDWHGSLMLLAWALLLPLGGMLPRHRWLLRGMHLGSSKKELWWWLHLGVQLLGMSLFVAGFAIAWGEFPLVPSGGNVGLAHMVVGVLVLTCSCLQLVLGFFRYHPAGPPHPLLLMWNWAHIHVGRVTLGLAALNIFIGIYIYHTAHGAPLATWLTPAAGLLGVLFLVIEPILLITQRRKQQRNEIAPAEDRKRLYQTLPLVNLNPAGLADQQEPSLEQGNQLLQQPPEVSGLRA